MLNSILEMFFWLDIIYLCGVGGILLAKGRGLGALIRSERANHNFRKRLVREHRELAGLFLGGFIFLLIVAELMVRFSEPSDRGWLFYTHLGFAIPSLILLLLIYYKFNGIRYWRAHRYLANSALVLSLGTVITGAYLFTKL